MLDRIFLQILDLTAMGSLVIGIVLLVRLFLKKQPKIYSYCLWAVVLLRLLCPVSISMPVSLLPAMPSVENHYVLSDQPIKPEHIGTALEDTFQSAVSGQLGQTQQTITIRDPDYNYGYPYEVQYAWWNIPVLLGQYVWLLGVAVMLIISLAQLLKLKKRLREALRLEGNIYICDGIDTAFVMGIVKPKIYLPASLSEQEQQYILLHEQHHIRRFDHIFKALAFAALCLHWFNPLVWVAFILSGRDMEMSCDEAVIKKSPEDIRADYSATLLRLSTGRTTIAGAPLAFGEGDAGKRIRNLSKWKKPVLWVSILAAVCCAAVIVLCAVNNQGQVEMIFDWKTAPGKVGQTFTMPEYPGVTFRLCGNTESPSQIDYIIATKGDETIPVMDGMPVMNLFLCDLNGDGKRELCCEVNSGSGYMRCFVAVCNYANQSTYMLGQEGRFDYVLRMEGAKLTADCYTRRGGPHPTLVEGLKPLSSGRISLVGQQLLYIPKLNISDSTVPVTTPQPDTQPSTGNTIPVVSAGPAEAVFGVSGPGQVGQTFTVPEFPGVTFRLEGKEEFPRQIERVTATQNGKTLTLLNGWPSINNLILCDLNGDGYRELCVSVTYGSGITDNHVEVYDYAAKLSIGLWERMEYRYWLTIEDGALMVHRYPDTYSNPDLPRQEQLGTMALTGQQLVFISGETVIAGVSISPAASKAELENLLRGYAREFKETPSYSFESFLRNDITTRYIEAFTDELDGTLNTVDQYYYNAQYAEMRRVPAVYTYLMLISDLTREEYAAYVLYDTTQPDQLFVCSEFRDRGYRDIESYYTDLISGKCQPVYDTFVIRLDSHSICRWGSNENLYESLANA